MVGDLGDQNLGIGTADVCEPPHGSWESNTGPLTDQQVLSTVEPSLQLPWVCL